MCKWITFRQYGVLSIGVTLALASTAGAGQPQIPDEALMLAPQGRASRYLIQKDPVTHAIAAGTWSVPTAGASTGAAEWQKVQANDKGEFSGVPRGGYLHMTVPSDQDCVMLMHARGHSLVYVNGIPRAGDPYGLGFVHLPIQLHAGNNHLLFRVSRGVSASLREPASDLQFSPADVTLPTLAAGTAEYAAAIPILNATPKTTANVVIESRSANGPSMTTWVPPIAPLTARKVPFYFRVDALGDAKTVPVKLTVRRGANVVHEIEVTCRVVGHGGVQDVTFRSHIDDSIQYYSVRQATTAGPRSAVVLSLHGAAVEARNQARSYAAKTWAHIVAPTNRRPYGFDWEDWGRLDAMEVLAHATATLPHDSQRIYLTGHSMGGHGTWQLGATFPDRFAAIGPSAGWTSFTSYAGAPGDDPGQPIRAMLHRSTSPSDTLGLKHNYAAIPIYVLHGDADDNVPVSEARNMREALSSFHHHLEYHEQPGAGHWWDNSDEPGAACVDWAPMFALFSRTLRPSSAQVRHVDFTTMNPAVSSSYYWATVEDQLQPLKRSRIQLTMEPGRRRVRGTTENVARLRLDLQHSGVPESWSVELDGTALEVPATAGPAWFAKAEQWSLGTQPNPAHKGPHRFGPFKQAFKNRMQFVYGTGGSEQDNAWALNKARYDAETFAYRGNGSVDVIPDTAFDSAHEPERNVIIYGHAGMHGAWSSLLEGAPVQVTAGVVRVGDRRLDGDDQAVLFVRPRPGSRNALVGVVAGTGQVGMRLVDRLPYFVSGIGLPDVTVLQPSVLTEGEAGVRMTGFFGSDWGVGSGSFVWGQ
jgi:dienelactone hydrolase